MLIKLIKYEIKGSFRELLPLYAVIIGLSLLIRPMFLQNLSDSWVGVTLTVYMALLVALAVISFLTVVGRFSKTMLGPEGYLMHTLPVSASSHILSKLAVSFLIMVLSVVVSSLSFLIIAADAEFLQLMAEFFDYLPELFRELFGEHSFFVVFQLCYLVLVSSAQSILLIYMALCIGHLFNRWRSIISVLAYIVGSSVIGNVIGFISDLFGSVPGAGAAYDSVLDSYYSFAGVSMIPQMVAVTLTAAGLFFGVRYVLEHRLNLE